MGCIYIYTYTQGMSIYGENMLLEKPVILGLRFLSCVHPRPQSLP